MFKAIIFDCNGVLIVQDHKVNVELLNFIRRRLKPYCKIGMLANTSLRYVERMLSTNDLLLFDAMALSSETGIAKPDPRAYQLIAHRLQASPNMCIFVDDFVQRCEAAHEQGMHVILYDSFEQVKLELEALLNNT